MEFSVDKEGHSDIESGDADHEQFTVTMESPKVVVWAVCGDGMTYNVYVEESSGLWDTPTHGVIGQYTLPQEVWSLGIDACMYVCTSNPTKPPRKLSWLGKIPGQSTSFVPRLSLRM